MIHNAGSLNDPAILETAAGFKNKRHLRSNTIAQIAHLGSGGYKQAGAKFADFEGRNLDGEQPQK